MVSTIIEVNVSDGLSMSSISPNTSVIHLSNKISTTSVNVELNITGVQNQYGYVIFTYLRCLYTSHILTFVSIPPLNSKCADFGNHLIQAIP